MRKTISTREEQQMLYFVHEKTWSPPEFCLPFGNQIKSLKNQRGDPHYFICVIYFDHQTLLEWDWFKFVILFKHTVYDDDDIAWDHFINNVNDLGNQKLWLEDHNHCS